MIILGKYNTALTLDGIPLITRGAVDYKANPTLASGDVKVSKDGGAEANLTTLPSASPASSSYVRVALSATEMSAARVVVTFVDQTGPKEWEDQRIIIHTYGHASAMYQIDLSDSVRMGLTALPNAAAEAAGGLYTRGSGAGQINQPANGQVDANVAAMTNGVITAAKFGAGAIDSAAIAANAIGASQIASNAFTSAKFASGCFAAANFNADFQLYQALGVVGVDAAGKLWCYARLIGPNGATFNASTLTAELLDYDDTSIIGTGAWTTAPTENAGTNTWYFDKAAASLVDGMAYKVRLIFDSTYTRYLDFNYRST